MVSGVTFRGHFRWYVGKVFFLLGNGGTIDFERPYNDFAVFWSSAASRKATQMRINAFRIVLIFLVAKNTTRNGVFIIFGDFRGPAWVPGGNLFSVF